MLKIGYLWIVVQAYFALEQYNTNNSQNLLIVDENWKVSVYTLQTDLILACLHFFFSLTHFVTVDFIISGII